MYSYCSATLTEGFPVFFFSCKANARVKLAKTGHGPNSSKMFVLFYVLFVLCRSVYCTVLYCTVLYCTVLYSTVLCYCHRVAIQLQLTSTSNEFCTRTSHTYRPIWVQLDVEDLHLLPLRSYKFGEKRWSEIHT